MKIKPTSHAGQVVIQLDWRDERLLEASSRPADAAPLRLKRILVPVDFSSCSLAALKHALGLARQFDAKVILLHVVEPVILPENLMLAVPELPEVGNDLVESARQRLEQLAAKAIPEAHRAPVLVRIGRPFHEITQLAASDDVDLIVISTHGYTGLKHVLMGSTAERVVRHAPCPVLTLRGAGTVEAA